ncbi:MAG: hypothetical protein Q4C01_08210 [Clostridia bacterium]|nr:hypothetical protein [Clostridia bacterium]
MTTSKESNRIRLVQARIIRLRMVRRAIAYLVKTIVSIVVGIGLCILSFMACMRLSNAYILVNEGMSLRAECILQDGEIIDLSSYFTEDCIANDASLTANTYYGYTITGYDYRLSFSSVSVWPWLSTITVEVVEQCDGISGSVNVDSVSSTLPSWTPIRYELTLSMIDDRWYISDLTVLEIDPEIDLPSTPDPNLTPMPAATATPEPEETP